MAITGSAAVKAAGDRPWSEAAAATLVELTALVRERAEQLHDHADVEDVHDARTATRRLRTAITVYGDDKGDQKAIEKELRRVGRKLGSVRDLDVLLETLEAASTSGNGGIDATDLDPLRNAWQRERAEGARDLKQMIDHERFNRALDHVADLAPDDDAPWDDGSPTGERHRISDMAPALIWDAFGKVLAFELDPLTADPTAIHLARIAAKKLRYTLEVFEAALEPGATLIREVTALQDAAGEMHDAIVARDRARSTIEQDDAGKRERVAAEAFADAQDRRAERQRPVTARRLTTVRSRAFRDSLGAAVAGIGHVSPGS